MAKVLLVEDERIVALALKHELAAHGHQVVAIASSGAQALEALATAEPEVVLMDVMIEGEIDGIETARQVSLRSAIPIIYLTGEADAATRKRAMHSPNCMGYLNKPVTAAALSQVILSLNLQTA